MRCIRGVLSDSGDIVFHFMNVYHWVWTQCLLCCQLAIATPWIPMQWAESRRASVR